METLRFLMVTTHYPPHHLGGDAVMVQNLSEELVTRGHEVHVANCPDVFEIVNGRKTRRHMSSDRRGNAPNTHSIHLERPLVTAVESHSLGMWGKAEGTLRRLLSDIKPDVVHWHNTRAFVGKPFSYERAVNAYTAHDFSAVCPKSSLLRPAGNVCMKPSLCQFCLIGSTKLPQMWRLGNRRVLSIPSDFRIISPSVFLARILASDGVRASAVIPNFVPDPGTHSLENQVERNSVVFIGILEPHKGPHVLLDAFSSRVKEHDMALEIIGEGSLRSELGKRTIRLGIEDRVRIPGRISRDEIRAVMGRAKVVVVPSIWYENCPLSAIEALSFGVPIIASNIGGLPEIATSEAGSTTFTPGSVDELGQELVTLHDNHSSLGRVMHMARKSYEEKYSPNNHVEMYMKMLS